MTETEARRRLGDTGQVYVTAAAAMVYADELRMRPEEARRELTELLLDAVPGAGGSGTIEQWRYRRRSTGLDISARVTREGRLAVVVSVTVRSGYSPRRGGAGGR